MKYVPNYLFLEGDTQRDRGKNRHVMKEGKQLVRGVGLTGV